MSEPILFDEIYVILPRYFNNKKEIIKDGDIIIGNKVEKLIINPKYNFELDFSFLIKCEHITYNNQNKNSILKHILPPNITNFTINDSKNINKLNVNCDIVIINNSTINSINNNVYVKCLTLNNVKIKENINLLLTENLEELYIENCNDLTGLELISLVPNLKILRIINCKKFKYLDYLPESLKIFECSTCMLNKIPSLPNGLLELRCDYNHNKMYNNILSYYMNPYLNKPLEIPNLPENLEIFSCVFNFIEYLPKLPNSLIYLNYSFNNVKNNVTIPRKLVKCIFLLTSNKNINLYTEEGRALLIPNIPMNKF